MVPFTLLAGMNFIDLAGLASVGMNIGLWTPGSGAALARASEWLKDNYDEYIKPTIERSKALRLPLIEVKRNSVRSSSSTTKRICA